MGRQEPTPLVSIIVPCRNEVLNIGRCLRSIFEQNAFPGGYEVIVADGMSDDGTREVLAELAQKTTALRIVENPGRIVSTGLNSAIRVARGQIIMRMDAHTEYASDYIRECIDVLEQSGADNVGGPARTRSEGYTQAVICAAYHSPFTVGAAGFHNVKYEGVADTVPYGCWRREVFDRIGYFDEELVRNQDDEFNFRLLRAGGKIWQSPRIKSWYKPRDSLRAIFRQYLQYGYWKVRVIQKHKIPASLRHLIPGLFVFALLMLPLTGLFWPPAIAAWLILIITYVAFIIVVSLWVASKNEYKLFPLLLLAIPSFHLSYGYGFLRGVCDFLILRRHPRASYTFLTRPGQ